MALSDEELRVAVAEAQYESVDSHIVYKDLCYLDERGIWQMVPNYPNDIKAVWELEEEIAKGMFHDYVEALHAVVAPCHDFALIHASPADRCRAYLMSKEAVNG